MQKIDKVKKEKIIGIILSVIIFIGYCTSIFMNEYPKYITKKSTIEKRDDIIKHMNEKYDKNFLSIKISGDKKNDDKYYYQYYVEGTNPDIDYCMAGREFNKTTNEYYYYDNYFGVQVRDEYEELINNVVTKYIDNDYVLYANLTEDAYPEKYDKNSTLQDFLDYNQNRSVDVLVNCNADNKEKFKEITDNIYNELSDAKYKGIYRFYFMKPGFAEGIDRTNYSDVVCASINFYKLEIVTVY